MDNILDRLGLYDIFGILIPGMSFLVLFVYMNNPLIIKGWYPSSQTFKLIIFIIASYIVGTLIQEVASFIDKYCTKMRKSARENFLDANKPLFKGQELQDVIITANALLNKDKNNEIFLKDECSNMFYKCKSYLENNDKMGKADKLDAIFAMSRDFIVCNICTLGCLLIKIIYTIKINSFSWCWTYTIIVIYTTISSIIFYKRAKRYSELRTRTIIRQYMDLKKNKI